MGATYSRMLEAAPVRTKAVTAATLSALGALLGHVVANGPEAALHMPLPKRAMFEQGLAGLLLRGPVVHYWIMLLWRIVPSQPHVRAVLVKVLLDQTLFQPFLLFLYFALISLGVHQSAAHFQKSLQCFVPILKRGNLFWGCFNLFNFFVTPPQFQVLAGNCAGIVWAGILSTLQKRECKHESKKEQEDGKQKKAK